MQRVLIIVGILFAFFALTKPALAADAKEQCISANEDADSLQKRGSLKAARTSLFTCAATKCPKVIRDDCAQRLKDIEALVPTIVFKVDDGGNDVADVEVTMDGAPLLPRVDGAAVEIDPGEHTFKFALKDGKSQTKKIVIHEGEKTRQEKVSFAVAPTIAPPVDGKVFVTTEAGAAIAIDGKHAGVGEYEGAISAGKHEVRISKPGRMTSTRQIDVKPGDNQTMNVTLEEEKKRSMTPWLIGGAAAIVAAGLIVGGVALAGAGGSNDTRTTAPSAALGGVSLKVWH